MSTSRDVVLSKVRAGLAAAGRRDAGRAHAEQRLASPIRHIEPSRVAGKSTGELVSALGQWLKLAGGDMIAIGHSSRLPVAVADYLRSSKLPLEIRLGEDEWLSSLPWSGADGVLVRSGPADPTDAVGMTRALAAVAETGTVIVASGLDNPVTLSFLPDTAIVVVRHQDVVGTLEDAFVLAREAARIAGSMPRTLNLISGPSRSADIGGIPVLGAHGPRRLCVMIADDSGHLHGRGASAHD